MKILLANPRGFCAGVDRAIEIVGRALELFGAPIYVRHEIVHNRFVVDDLRDRGAIFVDHLAEVPAGNTVIFSAHGVSQAVRDEAQMRKLRVFDATCPLVTKVHMEVLRHCKTGKDLILIGHAGHPEVEGTMGQWDQVQSKGKIYLVESELDVRALIVQQPENLAYATQTTLSIDDTREIITLLKQKFPLIEEPRHSDICYATQNRQDAVRELSKQCDLVLVIGSPNSSNSNRLRELAEKQGVPAFLINGAADIQTAWIVGKTCVGVTAGASAPEHLVQQVVARLESLGGNNLEEQKGDAENMVFALPKALRV